MNNTSQHPSTKTIDWEPLSREWESSQLSQQEFCKRKEVSYSLFILNRGKFLAKKKSVSKSRFSAISVGLSKEAKADTPLVLRLSNGVCLDIPLNIEATLLRPILTLLGVIC